VQWLPDFGHWQKSVIANVILAPTHVGHSSNSGIFLPATVEILLPLARLGFGIAGDLWPWLGCTLQEVALVSWEL